MAKLRIVDKSKVYHCKQRGKEMSLLEYFLGTVCHACCVKNQKEVAGVK